MPNPQPKQEPMSLPSILILASSSVILFLGTAHVLAMQKGRLDPRSGDLREAMARDSPKISSGTSMWKAWVGFNASHSLGALLFGVVFGYLATARSELFFASPFLVAVGFVTLGIYAVLGRRYWFHIPFRGIVLAWILYALGCVLEYAA